MTGSGFYVISQSLGQVVQLPESPVWTRHEVISQNHFTVWYGANLKLTAVNTQQKAKITDAWRKSAVAVNL